MGWKFYAGWTAFVVGWSALIFLGAVLAQHLR